MNSAEKELIETKLSALHADILANQTFQDVRDEHINDKLTEILEQVKKTNGRVNELENFRDRMTFFEWFTVKPIRLVLFFLIPVILFEILSIEFIKEFISKL